MKVAISHLSLNFLGGEEKLCLSFIKALKLKGHKVTLFTIEKTNWKAVERFFGEVLKPDEEKFATSMPIHGEFSKISTLLFSYLGYLAGLVKLNLRKKYDLTINIYGDLFNSIADISYVHFPLRATFDYRQIPAFTSPSKWALYSKIYSTSSLLTDKIKPSVLLTNSKFTQQVIKKYLNRNSLVLNPPVEVNDYIRKNMKRENYVVTISKFTPKRNLHKVPLIARQTKNSKFILAGIADEYSSETIKKLQNEIRIQGIEDRVVLLPNVPRSALVDLLAKAKVYLHVMPFEHFGISVIEAMAAGCVPVVHRSGGPWLDILNQKQGKNGFSYATLEEAAQIINKIMVDEKLRSTISSNAQKRALCYDISVFHNKLNLLVNKLGNKKGRLTSGRIVN